MSSPESTLPLASDATPDLERIRLLVGDDMEAVNRLITEQLASEVVLINQIGHYIVGSGGKRLRPLLVLLAARACGYKGTDHRNLAAIIEFIHTATLLHDDVVDASDLRRGNKTANAVWGNEASVLVGDFLYSRSFQMMVEVDHMRVMDIMAETTNVIAEGEVLQLLSVNDPDTDEDHYMKVIRCKTARLFEAGTRLAAVISGRPESEETALAAYGLHLGNAFQIADDLLDYASSAEDMGKNTGDDLADGKPTLPVIYAIQHGDDAQRQVLRHAIEHGSVEQMEQVLAAIENTGALDYCERVARREAGTAKHALEALPDSPFRTALAELADFAVSRRA
ncbi:MAG: octaprenyl diphosphate synthase [Gammaproteobacteria bacterium]|nr:MAG: octaprenyl diphosphate synthase [Gammaproteobacteria bacterium]